MMTHPVIEAGIKALAAKRETVFSETVPLKLAAGKTWGSADGGGHPD